MPQKCSSITLHARNVLWNNVFFTAYMLKTVIALSHHSLISHKVVVFVTMYSINVI